MLLDLLEMLAFGPRNQFPFPTWEDGKEEEKERHTARSSPVNRD